MIRGECVALDNGVNVFVDRNDATMDVTFVYNTEHAPSPSTTRVINFFVQNACQIAIFPNAHSLELLTGSLNCYVLMKQDPLILERIALIGNS